MRVPISLVAAGCVLTACSGSDELAAPPGASPQPSATITASSTATSSPTARGTVTCTSQVDGYAVDHPADWHARAASEREPCRWFSPEPIAPDAQQEPAAIPVRLAVVPHGLDVVQRLETADAEVLSSERREVDGRPAVRQELRSLGSGLLPEGSRYTHWLVEVDSRTLIATTTELATAGTYAGNVRVLDAVVGSLRRAEQQPVECSARDLPAEPGAQADLPGPVQEARRAVYAAAVRCDFERLAELVPEEGFTYSFGGGDDPTGAWRREELQDDGPAPMRHLAGVLQRPYGTREVQGVTHYSWPSAFTYDSWTEVPQPEREALKPLYDDQDLARFAQFGGYVGYRVSIAADGTWRVFVAGD